MQKKIGKKVQANAYIILKILKEKKKQKKISRQENVKKNAEKFNNYLLGLLKKNFSKSV